MTDPDQPIDPDTAEALVQRFIERIGGDIEDPVYKQLIARGREIVDDEKTPTMFHGSMMSRSYLQAVIDANMDYFDIPGSTEQTQLFIAQWTMIVSSLCTTLGGDIEKTHKLLHHLVDMAVSSPIVLLMSSVDDDMLRTIAYTEVPDDLSGLDTTGT